jgi:hypothetical protein
VVTDPGQRSVPLFVQNGQACVLPDLPFRRGDSNRDGLFDISDPITILSCLFLGGECPGCPRAGDANDDGRLDITDPVYLLGWRFSLETPAPPPPFPDCGVDPTPDDLEDCESFPPCQ